MHVVHGMLCEIFFITDLVVQEFLCWIMMKTSINVFVLCVVIVWCVIMFSDF